LYAVKREVVVQTYVVNSRCGGVCHVMWCEWPAWADDVDAWTGLM